MNPTHNLWAKSESENVYSMIFYVSNENDKVNFAKAWKCYKKGQKAWLLGIFQTGVNHILE